MPKERIISAIDVGTTKVCTIVASVNSGGDVKVLGVGVTPSHGMHKGLVVNIPEAKEAIRVYNRKSNPKPLHDWLAGYFQ